jgi:hypothetical protein
MGAFITEGQLYLHEDTNEYMIVTSHSRTGYVAYAGKNFTGRMHSEDFLDTFPPVDPEDIDVRELAFLESLCSQGTEARMGYVE